ncbi:MAG: hypothetical protein GY909_07680 [Oligoflexia bacterium]|nr:hypothetical protein [Oligoflexia bacterium]
MTEEYLKIELDNYNKENFIQLAPIAYGVLIILGILDPFFSFNKLTYEPLLIRMIVGLPTLIFGILLKKGREFNVDFAIAFSFLSVTIGFSYVSRLMGGLVTSYYFGLIVISFIMFTFTPLSLKKTFVVDAMMIIIYFAFNTVGMEYNQALFIQQLVNLLSFTVFKFVANNKSQKALESHLSRTQLEKRVEEDKKLKYIFGELFHLINNPLFIAMASLKRIKSQNLDDKDRGNQKMLKLHEKGEVRAEDYKKILSEEIKKAP